MMSNLHESDKEAFLNQNLLVPLRCVELTKVNSEFVTFAKKYVRYIEIMMDNRKNTSLS